MATILTNKWTRAVWREEDREEELVVPSSWIQGKVVRWPSGSSAVAALKEMRSPGANWLKFDLVKVKFSSDSKKECEKYDYTTTGETTDDESEVELPKRKPKKRAFSDFILDNGKGVDETSEKGSPNRKGGRKQLPPPPSPPDTESTQEDVSTSYRSRSPVRVRRLEDLDSRPSQNLLARARSPIRVSPRRRGEKNCSPLPVAQESTQEDVSTSYRCRSPVRVRRLADLDSRPSPNIPTRARSPIRESQSSDQRSDRAKSGFPLSEEKFQRKTIFLLTEIRNLLQSKSFNPACTEQPASDFTFNAVQDVEEFNALERDLEDSEFRGKLKTLLMKVGGIDESDSVKKCMQRCLSNACMAKMNLRGNRGKIAFIKTQIYSLIKDCILARFPRSTESTVNEAISKYLKYAPERVGGGGRREKD